MNAPRWLIETRNLTKIYGGNGGIHALDGVDLTIAPGELVSVMGPSGSGKSTLLNVIGALDRADGGSVIINGQDLTAITDLDSFRAHTVGFVFQLHNLLPTLTALENVEIPMTGNLGGAERSARARELLGMVGLADRMGHLPGQLSGGQRQRVAVARALANNPPLLLADEPTGSLDTASGQEILQLLRNLNHSHGVTILVVTHDLNVARQTNRVVFMQDGRIIREDIIGTPIEEDLKAWKHSGLGQHILAGDKELAARLGISAKGIKALQDLLNQGED
ncbi:MAG: ABC transporter ATP-binding protein [Anaerolineaceae bacterium]|nr:ABC transporter ATP-binding protein [Anaerolineaceae bacterium]